MNPIKFTEANYVLRSPEVHIPCWTDGRECITCWKPTEQEKALLAAGGTVYLRMIHEGGNAYSTIVTAVNPWTEPPSPANDDAATLRELGIKP